MASMVFKGTNDYIAQLQKLGNDTDEIIGKAVYQGAAIVADAIKAEINALPIDKGYGTANNPCIGVNAIQKKGLTEGFGISKMQNERGYINVKIGFSGYNALQTKKYPNGQPNALIARAVVSGTSFRRPNQFIDRAQKSVKAAAEEKMRIVIDEEINALTEV